jgi:hypothetical protein
MVRIIETTPELQRILGGRSRYECPKCHQRIIRRPLAPGELEREVLIHLTIGTRTEDEANDLTVREIRRIRKSLGRRLVETPLLVAFFPEDES